MMNDLVSRERERENEVIVERLDTITYLAQYQLDYHIENHLKKTVELIANDFMRSSKRKSMRLDYRYRCQVKVYHFSFLFFFLLLVKQRNRGDMKNTTHAEKEYSKTRNSFAPS